MTNSKQLYKEYIAESFDCEALGLSEDSTPKEKAQAFLQTAKDCQGFSHQPRVADHLQGLGQGIEIEYMNFNILEQAKEFGVIDNMLNNAKFSKYKNRELALERVEEQILANYWNVMACYIMQMA